MKRLILTLALCLSAEMAHAGTSCYDPKIIFNSACLQGFKPAKIAPHHKNRGVPSFMKPYKVKMPKMKSWGSRGKK